MPKQITIFASEKENDRTRIDLNSISAFFNLVNSKKLMRAMVFTTDGHNFKTVNTGWGGIRKAFRDAGKDCIPAISADPADTRQYWLSADHADLLSRKEDGGVILTAEGMSGQGFLPTDGKHKPLSPRQIHDGVREGKLKIPLYKKNSPMAMLRTIGN